MSYEFVAFELVRLTQTNKLQRHAVYRSIAILHVYWCGPRVAHYKWLHVILYIESISLIHLANVSVLELSR